MAITWANIKTVFYGVVGDVEGYNTFFSTAQALGWAHECMREAAERTHFYDMMYEAAVSSGTASFGIVAGFFNIWRVEIDDECARPITADKLRHNDRFWEGRTGKPRWYLIDEYQTDLDAYTVRLYEIPDSDVSVDVYGYATPTIQNDTYPTYNVHLPEWFAYALAWGMLSKAYAADTQMRNDQIAAFYRGLWDDAILRLRARSFGRLKNEWEYQPEGPEIAMSIWDRIPSTITGP